MPAHSKYSPEIAERICTLLAEGQSLRDICKAPDLPHRLTVLAWARDNAEFAELYDRAREAQAEWYASEIIHIADSEEDPALAYARSVSGTLPK